SPWRRTSGQGVRRCPTTILPSPPGTFRTAPSTASPTWRPPSPKPTWSSWCRTTPPMTWSGWPRRLSSSSTPGGSRPRLGCTGCDETRAAALRVGPAGRRARSPSGRWSAATGCLYSFAVAASGVPVGVGFLAVVWEEPEQLPGAVVVRAQSPHPGSRLPPGLRLSSAANQRRRRQLRRLPHCGCFHLLCDGEHDHLRFYCDHEQHELGACAALPARHPADLGRLGRGYVPGTDDRGHAGDRASHGADGELVLATAPADPCLVLPVQRRGVDDRCPDGGRCTGPAQPDPDGHPPAAVCLGCVLPDQHTGRAPAAATR